MSIRTVWGSDLQYALENPVRYRYVGNLVGTGSTAAPAWPKECIISLLTGSTIRMKSM